MVSFKLDKININIRSDWTESYKKKNIEKKNKEKQVIRNKKKGIYNYCPKL